VWTDDPVGCQSEGVGVCRCVRTGLGVMGVGLRTGGSEVRGCVGRKDRKYHYTANK